MKAVEFEGTVTPNGEIAIPADIAGQLPPGESVHVVLRWEPMTDEDRAWRAQGRQQFEGAYAPEDAIHERLMDETPARSLSENPARSREQSERNRDIMFYAKGLPGVPA
jgi:hypothetical protein